MVNPIKSPSMVRADYSSVSGAKSCAVNHNLRGRDLAGRIQTATRNVSAKVLARAAGCSIRAAENTKQGINTPSLDHFLSAAREIPELRALALEVMGCEPINPDRERAIAMLVNSYLQRDA